MQFLAQRPDLETAVLLTSGGFVQPVSDELIEDVRNHINGDIVLRILEDETDCGFATFTVYGDLLYLDGIMLAPTAQGNAYARAAIQFARERVGARYLALRTQNPRMWAVGDRLCSLWLPNVAAVESDDGIAAVVELLREKRGLPHPLHQACYGDPLYGEKPLHAREEVQNWWDSICSFERGDGIVCVGRF